MKRAAIEKAGPLGDVDLRAVFSSIPDFAAANDNVSSSFNNFISFLT